MYKAIEEIGEYKIGDIVKDSDALVWIEMYKISPVKKIQKPKQVENINSTSKKEIKGILSK